MLKLLLQKFAFQITLPLGLQLVQLHLEYISLLIVNV